MIASFKAGFVFAMASLLALSLSVTDAASIGPVRTGAAMISLDAAPHAATTYLTPKCSTVPTSLVAKVLGESMFLTGTGYPNGQVVFFGKVVLVGGKPLNVTWLACNYAHNPVGLSALGVSVSYLSTSSSAQALAVVKSMCAIMRSISPSYVAPSIGAGACEQGHTGPMQSANGLVAVGNVVIQLFGSQSPAQTLALMRAMTPLIAKSPTSTTTTMPSAQNGTGKRPVVTVTTPSFSVMNGVIRVGLHCAGAPCSGSVTFSEATASANITLASANYALHTSMNKSIAVAVTADGANLLSGAPSNTLVAMLNVTVKGGRSINEPVTLATGVASTTVPTSTSTLPTTTTSSP